ncbi:unnamed protein product [Ranitomeya imitator]|uniref:Uncharacterized protein n=1 Tax=Ranitomeya imitator TaxID=111125 RepID=A0ABN9M2G9_9NEOB|nr:unnamed protein product [Ranitomeya imitator]
MDMFGESQGWDPLVAWFHGDGPIRQVVTLVSTGFGPCMDSMDSSWSSPYACRCPFSVRSSTDGVATLGALISCQLALDITPFILPYDKLKNGENFYFSPLHTVLHVILYLADCPPCYSLHHRLSSMLFSCSQTVIHVILSFTDCSPCHSLPHTLSSMLFSPSQTVFHVILSITDCPPCYSLAHRLSSMLFSPSQTVLHEVMEPHTMQSTFTSQQVHQMLKLTCHYDSPGQYEFIDTKHD